MSILKRIFRNKSKITTNEKMVDAAIEKAIYIKLDPKEILVMIKRLSPDITEETILKKIKKLS